MIFQAIQEKDFVNLINEIFWSQIFDQDFQCSSAEKSDLTQILEVFPATNPEVLSEETVGKGFRNRSSGTCSRVGASGHLHLRVIPMGHCPPSVGAEIAGGKNIFPAEMSFPSWNVLP